MFMSPNHGDWVVVKKEFKPTGLFPGAATIRRGRRGVVIGHDITGFWSPRIQIRIDDYFGTQDVDAPLSCLRVTHYEKGITAFEERSKIYMWVRIGALLSILGPLLLYMAYYRITVGSFDGIISELLKAAIEEGFAFIEYALNDPLGALLFAGITTTIAHIAFKRRPF